MRPNLPVNLLLQTNHPPLSLSSRRRKKSSSDIENHISQPPTGAEISFSLFSLQYPGEVCLLSSSRGRRIRGGWKKRRADAADAVRDCLLGGAADVVCAAHTQPQPLRRDYRDLPSGGDPANGQGLPACPTRVFSNHLLRPTLSTTLKASHHRRKKRKNRPALTVILTLGKSPIPLSRSHYCVGAFNKNVCIELRNFPPFCDTGFIISGNFCISRDRIVNYCDDWLW